MVNAKGKGNASTSISSPQNDAAKTAVTETTVSSPTETNLEEIVVVSETEDKVTNIMEEVKNEENAMEVVGNEENAIEEDNNRESAIEEEEKHVENATTEEENNKETAMEEEKAEENAKEQHNEENKGATSRKRARRKKVANGASETVAKKDKDKPQSSGKNNVSKKAESMGMIFMCSSKTKQDCFHYKVLGLPASKRDIVQKIYKGMRLFLFDCDLKLMYGIYKAAGPGGFNIEPKAFKSAFPSQVRFTVLEDCLPLAEDKFKKIIKDNYFSRNKFDCQLTSEQVKELCRLFIAASKGPESKMVGRSLRANTHVSVDRGRIRQLVLDEERHSAFVGERRYHDRPVLYEREVLTNQMAPYPRVPPLPPLVPTPSYTYERNLEVDAYRIGSRDPYTSYREREPPSYHDPVYSAGLRPEYHPSAALPSEYHSVGRPTEYRSSAGLPAEYHHLRPLYRY